jgi:hypothetical protein
VAKHSGPPRAPPPPKTVFCHNLIDFNRTFLYRKLFCLSINFHPLKKYQST